VKLTIALQAPRCGATPPADEKLHLIHIIGDEVGYDDLPCCGSKDIATSPS
jgi:hypothetical protein